MKKRLQLFWQKTAVLVLAGCLMFTMSAFAETAGAATSGASRVTMSFPDISAGSWAEKFVTKLALLNVVHGNSQGEYKPGDNISKQEAVIMAVGLTGLNVDANTDAYLKLSVKSWAKGYVISAIDHKMLLLSEELTNDSLLKPWGDISATREWVARLAIRAIGKDSEAQSLSALATGFTDDAKISADTRGYINEAVKLKIISGKPDGSFDPQGNITRAEMAVMLSNAETYLSSRSSSIVSGTVQDISAQSIKVAQANGTVSSFDIAPGTAFFSGETNKRIYSSGIAVNDQVDLIQINNTVYYVEVKKNQIQYEEIDGTLVSVSLSEGTLTINVDGQAKTYALSSSATVVDNAGNGLSISSLTPDSQIQISKPAGDDSAAVVRITVKAAPVIAMIKGTVEQIFPADNAVKVKDDSTAIEGTYSVPFGVEIKSGSTVLSGVADLHIGDVVDIQTKDDAVTSFELLQSSVKVVDGIVNNINTDDSSIYLKLGNNQLQGYYLADGAKIVIEGMASPGLADIQKSDSVSIEVDGNNLATKITVKNRKVDIALGKLVYTPYDDQYGTISLVVNNRPKTFIVSERTVLELNGLGIALKDAATYFPKGKKVDITYSGEQLISMSVASTYEGTLAQINSVEKTILLNTDKFGMMTFSYNYPPYVDIFGRSNTGLGDVNVGDAVKLMLDSNQDYVMTISVKQTKFFTVKSKLANTSQLNVTDPLGTDKLLVFNGRIPITRYTGQTMSYSDLMPGQNIMVKLTGSYADSIYVVKSTLGIATAVDASGSKLTLKDFGGIVKTYTFTSSPQIVINAASTASLAQLNVNDRVQLIEGLDGAYLIKRINGVQKSFFRYDSTLKSIEFMRATLSEQNRFDLADGVYVHEGSQTIALSSLKSSDKLMVYMMDNVIVEIEKLAQ